jgi:hypothetical protein
MNPPAQTGRVYDASEVIVDTYDASEVVPDQPDRPVFYDAAEVTVDAAAPAAISPQEVARPAEKPVRIKVEAGKRFTDPQRPPVEGASPVEGSDGLFRFKAADGAERLMRHTVDGWQVGSDQTGFDFVYEKGKKETLKGTVAPETTPKMPLDGMPGIRRKSGKLDEYEWNTGSNRFDVRRKGDRWELDGKGGYRPLMRESELEEGKRYTRIRDALLRETAPDTFDVDQEAYFVEDRKGTETRQGLTMTPAPKRDNVRTGAAAVGKAGLNLVGQSLKGVGAAVGPLASAMGEELEVVDAQGNVLQRRPYRNEERLIGGLGGVLTDTAARLYQDPNAQGTFLADALPSGIAQMGAQVATAYIAGPVAAGGLMVSSAAGAGYDDAIAAGADEQTAVISAALNAPIGALEMIPVSGLMRKVDKASGGGFVKALKRVLSDSLSEGVEEGIQEAVSSVLSNAVAQKLYDEDRSVYQNFFPSAAEGGAVGAIAAALMSGIANARAGSKRRGIKAPVSPSTPAVSPAVGSSPVAAVDVEGIPPAPGSAAQFNQVAAAGIAADKARRQARVLPEVAKGEWVADTPKGEMSLKGRWQVVDAGALLTSDQAAYDQKLQPRNRASLGSAAQVDQIARNLNPARLMDSATTDDGAPIVDGKGQVISGNGRVMALRAAYGMGTAAGYRDAVAAQAEALGVDTAGMKAPVLVRVLEAQEADLPRIAELSNKPKILERNAAEMAQADAGLLTPQLLLTLDPTKPLTEKANPEFFAGFVAASKDAGLMQKDGSVSPAARPRVANALIAALANGHPQAREVIRTLTEDAQALGLTKQLDALVQVAPALIRTGTLKPDYDLRRQFGDAMNTLVQVTRMNQERKANKLPPVTLAALTDQVDWISPRDPVADSLAHALVDLSPEQLAQALGEYERLASAIDTSTGDMFGTANATSLELIQRALAGVKVDSELETQGKKPARAKAAMMEPISEPASLRVASASLDSPISQMPTPPAGSDRNVPRTGGNVNEGMDVGFRPSEPASAGASELRNVPPVGEKVLAPDGGRWTVIGGPDAAGLVEVANSNGDLRRVDPSGLSVLPAELRESGAQYGVDSAGPDGVRSYLEALNVPENEIESAAREQLELFGRIEAAGGLRPYAAVPAVDADGPASDLQRESGGDGTSPASKVRRSKKARENELRIAAALRNPLKPGVWDGLLSAGKSAFAVLRERFQGERTAWPVQGLTVQGPQDAMALAMMLRSPYQESLKVLALDGQGKVLEARVSTLGILNASLIHARESLANLPKGTKQVVMLHNHPSGDPKPSTADLQVTRQMKAAAEAVGLKVLDHVITDSWVAHSLRQSGLVQFDGAPIRYAMDRELKGREGLSPDVAERTANEPDLAPWELVSREDLKKIYGPEELMDMARALRQGNPGTGFVVHFATRMQVIGVTAVDFGKKGWQKRVGKAMVDARGNSAAVILPEGLGSMSAQFEAARFLTGLGKTLDIKVEDVIDTTYRSLRDSGIVAFDGVSGLPQPSPDVLREGEPTRLPNVKASVKGDAAQPKLVQQKQDWEAANYPVDQARALVNSYYKPENFADLPKDAVLVSMPSSSKRNILPFLLAEAIQKSHGHSVVKGEDVTQAMQKKPMKGKSFLDRMEDPASYAALPALSELAKMGRPVVIVDDIHTTGDSTQAFAELLRAKGIQVHSVAVLAGAEMRPPSVRDIERLADKVSRAAQMPLDDAQKLIHDHFHDKFRGYFRKADAAVGSVSSPKPEAARRLVAFIAAGTLQRPPGGGQGDVGSAGRAVSGRSYEADENGQLKLFEAPASYGRRAYADQGDVTGPGWPGAALQNAFRPKLGKRPEAADAGASGDLSRWIGAPVQMDVGSLLARAAGDPNARAEEVLSLDPAGTEIRVDVDPFKVGTAVVDARDGWEGEWDAGRARFRADLSNAEALDAVRAISMPVAKWDALGGRLDAVVKDWDAHVSEEGVLTLVRPGHMRQMVELPELVAFAQAIGEGRIPAVMGRFKNARWLGVFRPSEGGSITLRADIFQLITAAEMQRMSIEASLYAEKMREADPDNIDGAEQIRIAAARFDFLVGEAKRKARDANPKLASKVLAHELGHWVDHLPDSMIGTRGNILGRLGSLTRYLKSELAKDLGGSPGLSKVDRNWLRSQARKRVKDQGIVPGDPQFKARENEMYRKLRDMRRKDQGLVTRDEVTAELSGFSAWWRGSAQVTDYEARSEELYADLISGYLLNPAELGRRAPLAYEMLESYLVRKPEVKALWDKLQDDIASGQVQKDRVEAIRGMFAEGAKADMAGNLARQWTKADWMDAFRLVADRKFGPVYRRAAKWKNAKAAQLVEAIARYRYRTNQHERYVQDVNNLVMKGLVDENLSWMDLEEYVFHYRVMNERENMANPLGMNVSTSRDRLAEWERSLGAERFAALEEARKELRKLYVEHVLEPLERAGVLEPDLMEYLLKNEAYATFSVHYGEQDAIEQALRVRYGDGVSTQIYKQTGTLQKIRGPAVSTMEKGIRLINLSYRNEAIKGTVEMMREAYPQEIVPAEMRWNGRRQAPVMVDNEKVKTIVYLDKGEVKAFNVPKPLAAAWETTPNIENIVMRKMNEVLSRPLKALFTGWNYGLWPVLWMRDVQDFKRRMPRVSNRPGGGPQYWRNLGTAVKAAASMASGNPNDVARAAMDRGLTVSSANLMGIWQDEDAIVRLLRKYNQNPMETRKDHVAMDVLNKAWGKYLEVGQIMERASKIAGMLYMDQKFGTMPEYLRNQKVRQFAGSQDLLDTPTGLPVIDLFQMFYNPWKQGWRSGIEAWKQHGPAMWAYTQMKYSVIPQVLKYSILSGAARSVLAALFGDDEAEEIQRMLRSVSDFDMAASHIIPLGWDNREERTVRYLRLPMSEEQRLIAATVWRVLQAVDGEQQVSPGRALQESLSYAGDQLPAGNPLMQVGSAVWRYATGENPVDPRNGYEIIPPAVFEARDARAAEHIAKYAWNNLGGTVITRFQLHEPDRELSPFEKMLQQPVLSNTLGRFIRVSNRGLVDALRPTDERIRTERARTRLDIRDAVQESKPFTPTSRTEGEMLRREMGKARQTSMQRLEDRLLDRASSRESEEAMRQQLREILN